MIYQDELDEILLADGPIHFDIDILTYLDFNDRELNDITFNNCDLNNSNFEHSRLENVVFNNCNISDANFNNCLFVDCTFIECIGKEVNFEDSNFINTSLNLNIFRFSNFNRCVIKSNEMPNNKFKHCSFHAANLNGSNLSNCTVFCCTFLNTYLYDVKINNTDFRFSNIECSRGLKMYYVGHVGTFRGTVRYLPEIDYIFSGCWKGTFDEYVERNTKVVKDMGDNRHNLIETIDYLTACRNTYFKHYKTK